MLSHWSLHSDHLFTAEQPIEIKGRRIFLLPPAAQISSSTKEDTQKIQIMKIISYARNTANDFKTVNNSISGFYYK